MPTFTKTKRDAWLIFSFFIVIQLVSFRATRKLHPSLSQPNPSPYSQPNLASLSQHPIQLFKRAWSDSDHGGIVQITPIQPSLDSSDQDGDKELECQPLPMSLPPQELCLYVIKHCPPSGHLDYLRLYYCSGILHTANGHPPGGKHLPEWYPGISLLRIISLMLIFSWMLLLFSSVGVVASDFFSPNLSTIAARLGLNESTTGVTFLALGNGSPDLFSTFSAMKSGSGSLAIGELLGAASFIVSVISGSMMLIAPFRVKAWPFCRDVGFFTLSVLILLVFLLDGKITMTEGIVLISVYVTYAATVVIGTWWQDRRRRQRLMLAAARGEYDNSIADVASARSSIYSNHPPAAAVASDPNQLFSPYQPSMVTPSEYEPNYDPFESWANAATQSNSIQTPLQHRDHTSSTDPLQASSPTFITARVRQPCQPSASARHSLVSRHSLLSAIEFRDVVSSLKQEASADLHVSQQVFQSWEHERLQPQHFHPRHRRNVSRDHVADRPATLSPIQPHPAHANKTSSADSDGFGSPVLSRIQDNNRQVSSPFESKPPTVQTRVQRTMSDVAAKRPLLNPSSSTPLIDASEAPGFEDPWREHNADDDCQTLSPSFLTIQSKTMMAKSVTPKLPEQDLSKLEIPSWESQMGQPKQDNGSRSISSQKSVPVIKVTLSENGDDEQEVETVGQNVELYPTRIRPQHSLLDSMIWKTRVVFFALFPSLIHLGAKSVVGKIVSLLTAPTIMLLNLTLPVVDEEGQLSEDDKTGALRLEGDESSLEAHARGGGGNETDHDDDNEDDGDERVVTLGSRYNNENVANAEERVEAAERAIHQEHAQRDWEIAAALFYLPQTMGSPYAGGSEPWKLRRSPTSSIMPIRGSRPCSVMETRSVECTSKQEAEENETRISVSRFLMLSQCVFAPALATWVIASNADANNVATKVVFSMVMGLALSLLVFTELRRIDAGKVQYSAQTLAMTSMLRCSIGFLVSVLWIMMIVDEVVSILQAIGVIVGLSDAILGLTLFAFGNSLGDLVANITIARLGHPVMAISACFAGPLLNILIGIGASSTWLLSGHGNQPPMGGLTLQDGSYTIESRRTLLVSGLGLLVILIGTLIAVPMNGYHLTRPIGVTLIAMYLCIMTLNLLTELFWVQ